MTRILGLDTGTNSLGWAIVETTDSGYQLIDRGSHIFQEGVNRGSSNEEISKAAERTGHRSLRVRYYRIKLRKLRLLRVLSDAGLCPLLTSEELGAWRLKKVYPQNAAFLRWQTTDDVLGINPYAYRHRCLHERLDLSDEAQRFILGRAFYHIVQRRGFLSNRKDEAESSDEGKVKEGISDLSAKMAASGVEFLGDYFYQLYKSGERIRCRYTAREEHYLKEFRAICRMQHLDAKNRVDGC